MKLRVPQKIKIKKEPLHYKTCSYKVLLAILKYIKERIHKIRNYKNYCEI